MEKEKVAGFIYGASPEEERFNLISQDMYEYVDLPVSEVDILEFNFSEILRAIESRKYKVILFDTFDFRYVNELYEYFVRLYDNRVDIAFIYHHFDTRTDLHLLEFLYLLNQDAII